MGPSTARSTTRSDRSSASWRRLRCPSIQMEAFRQKHRRAPGHEQPLGTRLGETRTQPVRSPTSGTVACIVAPRSDSFLAVSGQLPFWRHSTRYSLSHCPAHPREGPAGLAGICARWRCDDPSALASAAAVCRRLLQRPPAGARKTLMSRGGSN